MWAFLMSQILIPLYLTVILIVKGGSLRELWDDRNLKKDHL